MRKNQGNGNTPTLPELDEKPRTAFRAEERNKWYRKHVEQAIKNKRLGRDLKAGKEREAKLLEDIERGGYVEEDQTELPIEEEQEEARA